MVSCNVLWKVCMYACMHVCMYVCMYVRMYVCVCMYVYLLVFLHPREQNVYLKLESSLYVKNEGFIVCIPSRTGMLCLEGMFLSQLKSRCSDRPQTSRPTFLVVFSGILQPKNRVLGLMGIQGMRISSFGMWVWPALTWTKMKNSLDALLKRNNMIERL